MTLCAMASLALPSSGFAESGRLPPVIKETMHTGIGDVALTIIKEYQGGITSVGDIYKNGAICIWYFKNGEFIGSMCDDSDVTE